VLPETTVEKARLDATWTRPASSSSQYTAPLAVVPHIELKANVVDGGDLMAI
jgi:hypothetical protein